MWRLALCLLLVAFSLPALAQVDCALGKDHNAVGQAAIVAGDFATAIEEYTCTIDAVSFNYDAYVGRALAKLLSDDFRGAFADMTMIELLGNEGISTAIDQYTALIDSEPSATLYAVRGVLRWMDYGDPQAVIDDMNSASALEADLTVVPFLRGLTGLETHLVAVAAAEADIAEAFDRVPSDSEMYRILGNVARRMGDIEHALESYGTALELDPTNIVTYASRGLLHRLYGNDEQALADLTAFVDSAPPDDVPLALHVAAVYLQIGNLNLALGDLAAAGEAFLDYIDVTDITEVAGDTLMVDVPLIVKFEALHVYRLPLELDLGQTISLSAVSIPAGQVDPLIVLVTPDGSAVTANDNGDDSSMDSAILDFKVPEGGMYSLVLMSDPYTFPFGDVELTLTIS